MREREREYLGRRRVARGRLGPHGCWMAQSLEQWRELERVAAETKDGGGGRMNEEEEEPEGRSG